MMPAQQARSRMPMRRASQQFQPAGSCPGVIIPYDHAATFELKGVPGNILQSVVNVSSDGIFVATAIGYGFEEDRAREIDLFPKPTAAFTPGSITLSQVPVTALIEGFRLNPRSERFLLKD